MAICGGVEMSNHSRSKAYSDKIGCYNLNRCIYKVPYPVLLTHHWAFIPPSVLPLSSLGKPRSWVYVFDEMVFMKISKLHSPLGVWEMTFCYHHPWSSIFTPHSPEAPLAHSAPLRCSPRTVISREKQVDNWVKIWGVTFLGRWDYVCFSITQQI